MITDAKPAPEIKDTPALRALWDAGVSERKICGAMGWSTTTFQRRVKAFGYPARYKNYIGKNLEKIERKPRENYYPINRPSVCSHASAR